MYTRHNMRNAWQEGFEAALRWARDTVKPADPNPYEPNRCGRAWDNTAGLYYCTRERGHEGPCAAVPLTDH